jgi:hypothetical protein
MTAGMGEIRPPHHEGAKNTVAQREGYYELEHGGEVFYIHVYPDRSKVLLLATWHKDCPVAT